MSRGRVEEYAVLVLPHTPCMPSLSRYTTTTLLQYAMHDGIHVQGCTVPYVCMQCTRSDVVLIMYRECVHVLSLCSVIHSTTIPQYTQQQYSLSTYIHPMYTGVQGCCVVMYCAVMMYGVMVSGIRESVCTCIHWTTHSSLLQVETSSSTE